MKTFLALAAATLSVTGGYAEDTSPTAHLQAPAAVSVPSITYAGTKYELEFNAKNPEAKLELWEYTPEGDNIDNWSRMITVHHYQSDISPADLAGRMAALAKKQNGLVMYNGKESTVCLYVHDSKVMEANAWKFAKGPGGQTWGNGLQWRFPVADTKALEAAMGENGVFGKACKGLSAWQMQYPRELKK